MPSYGPDKQLVLSTKAKEKADINIYFVFIITSGLSKLVRIAFE